MRKGDWLTVEQFAEWTGSAVSTIRNMCKQRKLPSKKFGVYVEINGISGLLKNSKFAKDFSLIKEVHQVGDTLEVALDHVSKNGKLQFKAVKPYENPTIIDISNLEEQTVMHGRIRSIQPWGVFVCIAPGLDALANAPENLEIEEDMEVRFIITQVLPEQNRVRGKIQSVINN